MVLPHRIELWTSPLPRECSTTELRQQAIVLCFLAVRAVTKRAIYIRVIAKSKPGVPRRFVRRLARLHGGCAGQRPLMGMSGLGDDSCFSAEQ
jgi:hypothetical protein